MAVLPASTSLNRHEHLMLTHCDEAVVFQIFKAENNQLSHGPTTDYGSTINHFYYNGQGVLEALVVNTYYSYLDMIVVTSNL